MYHNLQMLRERGTVENNKFHLLPLQELELKVQRVIGVDAHRKIEKKVPIVAEPWWIPPNIRIAPDAKTAAKEHNELRKVNLVTHRRWRCQVDIGPSDQLTVYGAELMGIWMALDMCWNEVQPHLPRLGSCCLGPCMCFPSLLLYAGCI
jgi:hypothetical protein